MSISITTIEGLLSFSLQFFDEQLDLYYTRDYFDILLNMLDSVLPLDPHRKFYRTIQVLKEPIVVRANNFLISEQTLSNYVNSEILVNKYFGYFEKNNDLYSFITEPKTKEDEIKFKTLSNDKKYKIIALFRLSLIVRHCYLHILTKTTIDFKHDESNQLRFANDQMEAERGLSLLV